MRVRKALPLDQKESTYSFFLLYLALFCIDSARIFRSLCNFINKPLMTNRLRNQHPRMSYCPFTIFQGLWFPDNGFESTDARALVHVLLNLNTRSIEVVHIVFCFLLFFFKIAIRREQRIGCKEMPIFLHTFLYIFLSKHVL